MNELGKALRTNRLARPLAVALGGALMRVVAAAAGQAYDWPMATPASQGMSGPQLDALRVVLAHRSTRAFLVLRNDQIVYEWYAPGATAETPQGTASLAKALVGGLSLGVALNDGLIQLDDPAHKYIPEWRAHPQKALITIRQLGSHTSGLADAEAPDVKHEDLPGWMGAFWKRLAPPDDPFTIARDKVPVLFEPGRQFQYSNPGIGLLTYCVTAVLTGAPQQDIRALLKARVMRPLGIPDAAWSAGYGKTFVVNGRPLVAAWGGGSFTPRATARLGQLVLHRGDWAGRHILTPEAVRQTTCDAGLPGHCGMGWWTNHGRRYAWLPEDAVWGAGAGDQVLLVVPSLGLVMVRNGAALVGGEELQRRHPRDVFEAYHDPRAEILFKPLVAAITPPATGAAPYPPSPVLARLDWAPPESIVRRARGSDNWPLTWADDDHQYTAYGDGNGFEPYLGDKLGLGLARIEGGAESFTGFNIRAPSVENTGQGRRGRKASGLLMVGGVLYLWARNADHAQLAWSPDHGRTWQWAGWKFTTSFGCPTFLNFGRNYAGARDDFVYVYSPDADTAYQPADRMVLARVPKDKLLEQGAYEFFQGLDARRQPHWTRRVAERGAVFAHAGRCYRSGITYDAGLRRYLWAQCMPGTEDRQPDPRFQGGLGIFDAPEPWGPWSTVFFTPQWDVGPGDTASFPAKWMSADGRTLYLVFSGDDHFAVRQATLTPVVAERP